MSLAGPPPLDMNPLRRVAVDIRRERAMRTPWPPGDTLPSLVRTHRMVSRPLQLLLDLYARYGPIFTVRVLHSNNVFMLGPKANHRMLVSHAEDFVWREGGFQELVPLLGDGMLTIDGDFHRRSRRIMLPAFHRDQIAAALTTMENEAERALAPWRPGTKVDLYRWTRTLALRIAMRALFGFDPDERGADVDAAHEFEKALGFYGHDYTLQVLRGPRTPHSRMMLAKQRLDRLIYSEIERRRRTGERGEDVLSLLLDAHDQEDGTTLSDRHIRDHVMTLLFAGHDTTTATVAFMFYELARAPEVLARVEAEVDAAAGQSLGAGELLGGALPELDMALDETLRLWPPAWIGPRRAVREFEFEGVRVPAGAPVNYSSWVSHRLPDVWDAPEEFRPERFTPENRATIPKGAYVPFGGGSRICLGMRFGQLEIKAITLRILSRWRLEQASRFRLRTSQTPTIGPKHGMPMIVRERL